MASREYDAAGDNPAGDDEALAAKLDQLSTEKLARYEIELSTTLQRNGKASAIYRHGLADMLLRNLPAHDESREITKINRREDREILAERQRGGQAQDLPAGNNLASGDAQKPAGTHATAAQSFAQPDAPQLTADRLRSMLDRFAEVRRHQNMHPSPAEIAERTALAEAQNAERTRFENMHGLNPPQEQRSLLDHQHLAERAGIEAKWVADILKSENPVAASAYRDEARQAFHTAHQIHAERLDPHAGRNRDRAGRTAPQRSEPDMTPPAPELQDVREFAPQQSVLPEASPNDTLTKKEYADLKADLSRDIGRAGNPHAMPKEAKHQNPERGSATPGNARGGGGRGR